MLELLGTRTRVAPGDHLRNGWHESGSETVSRALQQNQGTFPTLSSTRKLPTGEDA